MTAEFAVLVQLTVMLPVGVVVAVPASTSYALRVSVELATVQVMLKFAASASNANVSRTTIGKTVRFMAGLLCKQRCLGRAMDHPSWDTRYPGYKPVLSTEQ